MRSVASGPRWQCEYDLAAYVEHRCSVAGAHQVERHLDGCPQCRAVVAQLAAPGALDRRRVRLSAGDRIDQFEILRRLGAGGMGVVYAARDHELDRDVALKLIHQNPAATDDSHVMTGAVVGALRDEAKTLARLSHRNVLTVYAVGVCDGRPYIAMELVEGSDLRSWLGARLRTVTDVCRVFAEAGRGLAAAHRAGVVHRDFKPDNVLVESAAGVRIVDFGLARIAATVESSVAHAVGQTGRTTAAAGTPAYMAPEQLEGRPADPRSDQYAFCVSLFEALHGHRPDVRPTGGRPARGRIPARLRRAIARGLAPDPADRWPSIDDLVRPLDAAASSGVRPAVWLGVVATVAAGALWGWVGLEPRLGAGCLDVPTRIEELRASDSPTVAAYAERWVAADRDACRAASGPAKHCLDGLATELELVVRSHAGSDHVVQVLPQPRECLRTRAEFERDPALEVRLDAARAAMERGALGETERISRAVVDEARRGAQPLAEANGLKFLAWAVAERSQFEQADRLLRQALAAAGTSGADELVATLWIERAGLSYRSNADHREALRLLEVAQFALERADATRSMSAVDLLQLRGTLRSRAGRSDAALADLERALELVEYNLGSEDASVPVILVPMATEVLHVGGPDGEQRAEALLRRAWTIVLAQGDGQHHAEAAILNGLAKIDVRRGDSRAAAAKLRQAIAVLIAQRSAAHPSIGHARTNLAVVLLDDRAPREALVELGRARDVLEAALGPDHPELASTHAAMARAHRAMGDPERECEQRARVVRLRELGAGPAAPDVVEPLRAMARCQRELGRPGEARATQRRADEITAGAATK